MEWMHALSTTLRRVEEDLKRHLASAVLVAAGLVFLCCGVGFAIAAIYMRLAIEIPSDVAAMYLAGGLALTGLIVIAIARIRTRSGARRPLSPSGISRQVEEAADQIVHDAASRVRRNSSLAMLTALALGVVAGFLGPKNRF